MLTASSAVGSLQVGGSSLVVGSLWAVGLVAHWALDSVLSVALQGEHELVLEVVGVWLVDLGVDSHWWLVGLQCCFLSWFLAQLARDWAAPPMKFVKQQLYQWFEIILRDCSAKSSPKKAVDGGADRRFNQWYTLDSSKWITWWSCQNWCSAALLNL